LKGFINALLFVQKLFAVEKSEMKEKDSDRNLDFESLHEFSVLFVMLPHGN
jgi:hypothetical protein